MILEFKGDQGTRATRCRIWAAKDISSEHINSNKMRNSILGIFRYCIANEQIIDKARKSLLT